MKGYTYHNKFCIKCEIKYVGAASGHPAVGTYLSTLVFGEFVRMCCTDEQCSPLRKERKKTRTESGSFRLN